MLCAFDAGVGQRPANAKSLEGLLHRNAKFGAVAELGFHADGGHSQGARQNPVHIGAEHDGVVLGLQARKEPLLSRHVKAAFVGVGKKKVRLAVGQVEKTVDFLPVGLRGAAQEAGASALDGHDFPILHVVSFLSV